MSDAPTGAPGETGGPLEVLAAFLKLGLTSFGGPIAHFGYFREEFVRRRSWLDESAFADLVALCQFLPGPSSSQVGFAIGLKRAGALGGLAAWTGFTAPSAMLMTAFAFAAASLAGRLGQGVVHGLKLVAVAVVAQAVLGMARTLTPDVRRGAIAVGAIGVAVLAPAMFAQLGAIALGGLAGWILCRDAQAKPAIALDFRVSKRVGLLALSAYLALLIGGPVLSVVTGSAVIERFDAFYRSGALVFGGGHVVLPLLKQAIVSPGWVSEDAFLAGYGAAQAAPGPLFTFAAYLGAAARSPPNGVVGAILGLVGIFLPGLLVLLAALPFWGALKIRPSAQATMAGANAAVVGILAAALYSPVWTSAVRRPADIVAAAIGFTLLAGLRAPPIVVVILGVGFGIGEVFLS